MHAFDEDATALARSSAREVEHRHESPSVADARSTAPDAPHSPAAVLNLQRAIGNAGVVQLLREGDGDDPHGLHSLVGSGGSPLDAGTKVQMESAIGADFSDVRIHTGGDADKSAKSLGAHAYTAGSDIVFAEGRYDPGSATGQRTLAHELTHVVQQRSGPVDGEMTDTGVRVSDPSDRFEQAAEANAERVVSGGPAEAAAPAAAPAAGVQREEDEMTAQGLFVQREGEEDEEVQGMWVQREADGVQREGEEDEEVAG
jgi:hypothetical protein